MTPNTTTLMYLTPEPPPARLSLPVSLSAATLRERLDPKIIATLFNAMEAQEAVCILYRSLDGKKGQGGQISARVVWPDRVWVTDDGHVAVRGYDSRRAAVRCFRCDRIADAHLIEP